MKGNHFCLNNILFLSALILIILKDQMTITPEQLLKSILASKSNLRAKIKNKRKINFSLGASA